MWLGGRRASCACVKQVEGICKTGSEYNGGVGLGLELSLQEEERGGREGRKVVKVHQSLHI